VSLVEGAPIAVDPMGVFVVQREDITGNRIVYCLLAITFFDATVTNLDFSKIDAQVVALNSIEEISTACRIAL